MYILSCEISDICNNLPLASELTANHFTAIVDLTVNSYNSVKDIQRRNSIERVN